MLTLKELKVQEQQLFGNLPDHNLLIDKASLQRATEEIQ